MPEEIRLGAAGIWTEPNELAPPNGALREALNVRIRRPGVIEPRDAFPRDDVSAESGHFTILTPWSGGVLAVGGTKLYHLIQDGAQTEITDPGGSSLEITNAESCLVEVSDGVMVPTDNGVYYVDADLDAYPAGILPPSPVYAADGSGGSSVPNGSSVAFRALTYRELPSGRAYFSGVSDRVVYTNSSGGALDVTIRVRLPVDAVAGDVLQVYASEVVAGTPSDEMALLNGVVLTSSHITDGYYQAELNVTEADGASLYTNETQEGILQSNLRPQPSKRVAWFNGMAFYGDVKGERRWTLEGKASNTAEELTNDYVDTATFSSGSAVVSVTTAEAQWAGLPVAEAIGGEPQSDGTYIPAGTYIDSVDTGANTFTMSNNALASGSAAIDIFAFVRIAGFDYIYYGGAGSADTRIGQWQTGEQLIEAVNLQGDVVAAEEGVGTVYQLATGSESLGYIRFSSTSSFTIEVFNGIAGTGWIWRLWSSAGGTYTATEKATEDRPSRLMWSKVLQPEAVPAVNFIDLGAKDEPILGLEATRDSLFVFKRDGVWRVSGDSPETLRVDEHDRSLSLIHPRAVTTYGNDVWAWTTRGIMRINEGGAEDMSGGKIRSLIESSQRNIVTRAAAGTWIGGVFAGGAEVDGVIMFGVPADNVSATNRWADHVYVYEARTGAWVRWRHARHESTLTELFAGVTEDRGKILFGCVGGVAWAHDDTSDFTTSVTVSGITANPVGPDGVTYPVQIDDVPNGEKGRNLGGSAWILFDPDLDDPTRHILDSSPGPGTKDLHFAFESRVEWAALTGGNPSQLVHWRDVQLALGDGSAAPGFLVGFSSERVPTEETVELRSFLDTDRPEPVQLRGMVTRSHARSKRLRVSLSSSWALSSWRLEGLSVTFNPQRGGERTP